MEKLPSKEALAKGELMPLSKSFRTYRSRWWMLLLIVALNVSNAVFWISFAPIQPSTQEYYGVSKLWVNMLSMIFMILYIPLGFTSSWALDAKGLRYGALWGALLNLLGGWLRYASELASGDGRFAILFLGQSLTACAQPFILNAPTKLAAVWFGEGERATANMLASISNPLGIAIGSVVTPFIVVTPSDMPYMLLAY
eukprot:Colp12_sorted_trinity150504_noHs@24612